MKLSIIILISALLGGCGSNFKSATASQPVSLSSVTPSAAPAPAAALTVTGAASASYLNPGNSVTLSTSITSNVNLSNLNIDLEVRDPSNNQIAGDPQNVSSAQTLTANKAARYSWTYDVPATLAAGNYCFVVAVFDSTWATVYTWDSCVASFTVAAPIISNHKSVQLPGVNISGGEYNTGKVGARLNYDYVYPNNGELDYFASKGMKIIRVGFDGNRIQPTRLGPLSTTEMASLDAVVSYAQTKGLIVLLDPHNYGYLLDNSGVSREIGVDPLMPNSYFADFWSKLSAHYVNTSNVYFGLMNEPNAQTAVQWKASAVAAVNAIRATGAKQKITIPGTAWTGGYSWVSSGNAAAWTGFTDSNFAFEVHEYLDSDNSGTHSVCATGSGSTGLVAFTTWARTNGYQGFLGESGWATNAGCMTEGNAIMDYLRANSDVWLGYTYWDAGAWLGNYMYSIEPLPGPVDQPQMSILLSHE